MVRMRYLLGSGSTYTCPHSSSCVDIISAFAFAYNTGSQPISCSYCTAICKSQHSAFAFAYISDSYSISCSYKSAF